MLRARTVRRCVRSLSSLAPTRLRRGLLSQNIGEESPPCPPPQDESPSSTFMQDQLSRPASFTFGFFKRFAKLSILGIVSLGLNGIAVFEGAHMGVENVKHAPDIDPETKC
ncbi:hypothetical protein EDD16DRAFT_658638 [Pisolithus croceorrhizus]|nr:hypothetical protein EDD16DRAFT_658638 [Pisolithus croceorrhizus]